MRSEGFGFLLRHTFRLIVAFGLLLALLGVQEAEAAGNRFEKSQEKQEQNDSNETLITAQQMTSDQATNTVTAQGRVEIARGNYMLHADKVTYNQTTGVMHAEGHVVLLDPQGNVEFAEKEDITGDMKQAFAQNVGILFPDSSRLTARTVQRYDGRYTVANNGLYTACNVCKQDPDHPPFWQLRADEVVHDNETHDLYYHDTTIDFLGAPVFYTPYLSGPDPTVDRRQGFLTASPGVSSYIGTFVRVPYYFDIAPNTDAILAPTFSEDDTLQMAGEFRHRLDNGSMQFDGSFTRADLISDTGTDEGQQWRGHLFGNVVYDIDNVWRAGADVAFTSDLSYLYRYQISSADELTNRVYLEGFQGRDYAAVNSYLFEDLRPGPQPVQPFVLPDASINLLGEPGATFGGRWSLDANALVTTRENGTENVSQQGPDTRRLSLDGGWQRELVSNSGLVTTVSGLIRDDNYWADNVINPNDTGETYNNVKIIRPFEQANAVVKYPLGREGDGYQQLFEPIVSITAAPTVKPNPETPIEDSMDVEFNETNLFSPNRFTGDDLIEGGSRVTYGLRQMVTTDSGGRVDLFGGQSYDFNADPDFPTQSGLHDNVSDWVGRLDFVPVRWFDFNYGARLDHKTFSPQEQDGKISVGTALFRPYFQYIQAYQLDTTTNLIDQVKQGTFGFDSHFLKYWSFHAEQTQGFEPDPGPRDALISLNYADECFIFGVSASQTETDRADLNSGFTVTFHFYLRNVGGLHTDSFTQTYYPPEFRQF